MDNDTALIDAYCQRGDQTAFAELVSRYRERVFRLTVSILGPGCAGEAEEVTQDVFVAVSRALTSFRGDAQFSSWIYRIAFNQAVNLKNHVRFRATHVGEQALAEAASSGPGPLAQLETARHRAGVMQCVESLPEIYQAAVRLYYWTGDSIEEIAELLGVPENTVKSYLHRARGLLYEMLEERGLRNA